MKPSITIINADGYDQELPAQWAVCDGCRGECQIPFGQHIAFTGADLAEWDDEEKLDYFRGRYDAACPDCGGRGMVPELDRDRASPEEIAAYDQYQRDEAEYRAEVAAELRMGA